MAMFHPALRTGHVGHDMGSSLLNWANRKIALLVLAGMMAFWTAFGCAAVYLSLR